MALTVSTKQDKLARAVIKSIVTGRCKGKPDAQG
jgi:hypothetical protein